MSRVERSPVVVGTEVALADARDRKCRRPMGGAGFRHSGKPRSVGGLFATCARSALLSSNVTNLYPQFRHVLLRRTEPFLSRSVLLTQQC